MSAAIAQAHLDIARERFLDLMSAMPNAEAHGVACIAIAQADDFAAAYKAIGNFEAPSKLKGCKQCFGSGGKVGNPCRVCDGSGKVPA